MTLLSALKVARGACVKLAFHLEEIGADEGSIAEIEEAAAVLARLEEERPKIMEAVDWMVTMVGDDGDRWSEEERAECRGHTETLAALLSRLDAAPKKAGA